MASTIVPLGISDAEGPGWSGVNGLTSPLIRKPGFAFPVFFVFINF